MFANLRLVRNPPPLAGRGAATVDGLTTMARRRQTASWVFVMSCTHAIARWSTFLGALGWALLACGALASAQEKVTFDRHVKPILRQHCMVCHSQGAPSGGLALEGYAGALAGGASGEVLVSGDPDGSRLWKLITHQEQPVMPPGGEKLPEDQLKVIRQWIEGGLLENKTSKPKPIKKTSVAAVEVDASGKPVGEPAMPERWFREPVVTSAHAGPVDVLGASPWAPLVAIGWQRQVSLYHAETHQLLGVAPYVDGAPRVVKFSRDGAVMLVAGGRRASRGAAALYDVKSGARIATVGDELAIALAADVSPDKSLVALGGPTKTVRVYRVADGSLAYELTKHTDWITALAFSPDGELLASGDRSAGLRLWQAREGYERNDLGGHKEAITALAWRDDAAVLASASEDDTVRLWSAAGDDIKRVGAHGGGAMSVSFAKDGRFVTAGRDRKVKLWKPDGGHLADLTTMGDIALAARFTHDDSRVVASDYAGEVRLVDVESKERVTTLAPNPPTLTERIARAETKASEANRALESAKKQAESAGEAVARAEHAHAGFRKKLAAAERLVEERKKRVLASESALGEADKALAKASKSAAAAHARLEELEKQLTRARQTSADAEEATPEVDYTSLESDLKAAREASEAADKAAAEAKAAHDQHAAALADAQKQTDQASRAMAATAAEREGLPDLEALRAAHEAAQQGAETAQQRAAAARERREALIAERERFSAAQERLAERSQAARAKKKELDTARTRAKSLLDEADAALAKQQGEVEAVEEQLTQLRERLAELTDKSRLAQSELDAASEELAEADQAASIAEALLKDFEAAQTLRASYSDE